VRIRKSRIVERPRLFAILDESRARLRMLIAPAGYGKTTLAEQWVARDGRRGAWFTARSSSTDVAALALGIAQSATSIVAECDVRLRTHMRAVPAPAENVQTLAEILGEDLADWPRDAWLVVDDYHEVAQEPRAEDFVAALVSVSPVQFLIASRVRPSWVTTKDRLYGEALEVSQNALAMDNREAADVLVERSEDAASGLVTLANGWPAVIGLASASSAEIEDGVDQVPESLYRFFADEVFSALGPAVQQGLTTLAIAPVIDNEVAVALLGPESAESVSAAALDVGLLVEREMRLDLHPLARAFLEERSGQLGVRPSDGAAETCLGIYRERRDWDATFDLVSRARLMGELEDLMSRALDDLLETARLSTLERWCKLARDVDVDAPIFSLARAETMLRDGRHIEAIAHAEKSAAGDATLEFRALSVAGRAAHLASREVEALALYERAEQAATAEAESRDARWGQLACMLDLELPSAAQRLAELSEGVGMGDPREFVRAAGHGVYLQLRQASIDLDVADVAYQLLAAVGDPLVCSSFLSAYTNALVLSARYEDALVTASELLEIAERSRFDFALAYGLAGTAMAYSGLRRWRDAEDAVLAAIARARATRDVNADLVSRAILVRLYAQQGQLSAALAVDTARTNGALRSTIAEFVSSRALALACSGRTSEARELVDEVRGTTTVVELAVMSPAVAAVCALRDGSADVIDRTMQLENIAFACGAVDLLIVTYRACPELLAILLRTSERRRFPALVEYVGDQDLARASGHPIAVNDDKRLLLTPRETDVFELLRTGLSNREIGRLLYIEESTVKAHTHRIYEKLGVHSRNALTVQAALERGNQATSATESSSEDGS
jgi:DNA-binding NarL/FixJ family response regulator